MGTTIHKRLHKVLFVSLGLQALCHKPLVDCKVFVHLVWVRSFCYDVPMNTARPAKPSPIGRTSNGVRLALAPRSTTKGATMRITQENLETLVETIETTIETLTTLAEASQEWLDLVDEGSDEDTRDERRDARERMGIDEAEMAVRDLATLLGLTIRPGR